jgi:hypothetical protein
MSLINDALKKAQRQRGEGLRPPAGGLGAQEASPPMSPGTPQAPGRDGGNRLILAGGTLILIAVAVVAFVWWPRGGAPAGPAGSMANPGPAVALSQPNSPTPSPLAEPPPSKVTLPSVAPAAGPESVVPTIKMDLPPIGLTSPPPLPPPAAAPISKSAAVAPTAPAIAQAMVPEPAPTNPPVAPTAPEPPQRSRQVESLIDTMQVAAIRVSATDPRAMINDRVFKLDELVDRGTGLRLTQISANRLTFTDANGFVYVKNL